MYENEEKSKFRIDLDLGVIGDKEVKALENNLTQLNVSFAKLNKLAENEPFDKYKKGLQTFSSGLKYVKTQLENFKKLSPEEKMKFPKEQLVLWTNILHNSKTALDGLRREMNALVGVNDKVGKNIEKTADQFKELNTEINQLTKAKSKLSEADKQALLKAKARISSNDKEIQQLNKLKTKWVETFDKYESAKNNLKINEIFKYGAELKDIADQFNKIKENKDKAFKDTSKLVSEMQKVKKSIEDISGLNIQTIRGKIQSGLKNIVVNDKEGRYSGDVEKYKEYLQENYYNTTKLKEALLTIQKIQENINSKKREEVKLAKEAAKYDTLDADAYKQKIVTALKRLYTNPLAKHSDYALAASAESDLKKAGNDLIKLKNIYTEILDLQHKIESTSTTFPVNQVKALSDQYKKLAYSLEKTINTKKRWAKTEDLIKAKKRLKELKTTYKNLNKLIKNAPDNKFVDSKKVLKAKNAYKKLQLEIAKTKDKLADMSKFKWFKNIAVRALSYVGIYQIYTGIINTFKSAVAYTVEFDKSQRTLQAVLKVSANEASHLQHNFQRLAETYGGSLKDIDQVATELGRAGVATKDLTKATEVTLQMAMLTGDSYQVASSAIVSYLTVYKKAAQEYIKNSGLQISAVELLGNKLAKLANDSRMTTQDIGTFSNYALAAAKSAGATMNAVSALAVAFNNAGNNASTVGTLIRRFFNMLDKSSPEVERVFQSIGVNTKNLILEMRQGGKQSDAAFNQFLHTLQQINEQDFAALTANLDTLDKQALMNIRNNVGNIRKEFEEFINTTGGELSNASIIANSYVNVWERFKNVLGEIGTKVNILLTPLKNLALWSMNLFNSEAEDKLNNLSVRFQIYNNLLKEAKKNLQTTHLQYYKDLVNTLQKQVEDLQKQINKQNLELQKARLMSSSLGVSLDSPQAIYGHILNLKTEYITTHNKAANPYTAAIKAASALYTVNKDSAKTFLSKLLHTDYFTAGITQDKMGKNLIALASSWGVINKEILETNKYLAEQIKNTKDLNTLVEQIKKNKEEANKQSYKFFDDSMYKNLKTAIEVAKEAKDKSIYTNLKNTTYSVLNQDNNSAIYAAIDSANQSKYLKKESFSGYINNIFTGFDVKKLKKVQETYAKISAEIVKQKAIGTKAAQEKINILKPLQAQLQKTLDLEKQLLIADKSFNKDNGFSSFISRLNEQIKQLSQFQGDGNPLLNTIAGKTNWTDKQKQDAIALADKIKHLKDINKLLKEARSKTNSLKSATANIKGINPYEALIQSLKDTISKTTLGTKAIEALAEALNKVKNAYNDLKEAKREQAFNNILASLQEGIDRDKAILAGNNPNTNLARVNRQIETTKIPFTEEQTTTLRNNAITRDNLDVYTKEWQKVNNLLESAKIQIAQINNTKLDSSNIIVKLQEHIKKLKADALATIKLEHKDLFKTLAEAQKKYNKYNAKSGVFSSKDNKYMQKAKVEFEKIQQIKADIELLTNKKVGNQVGQAKTTIRQYREAQAKAYFAAGMASGNPFQAAIGALGALAYSAKFAGTKLGKFGQSLYKFLGEYGKEVGELVASLAQFMFKHKYDVIKARYKENINQDRAITENNDVRNKVASALGLEGEAIKYQWQSAIARVKLAQQEHHMYHDLAAKAKHYKRIVQNVWEGLSLAAGAAAAVWFSGGAVLQGINMAINSQKYADKLTGFKQFQQQYNESFKKLKEAVKQLVDTLIQSVSAIYKNINNLRDAYDSITGTDKYKKIRQIEAYNYLKKFTNDISAKGIGNLLEKAMKQSKEYIQGSLDLLKNTNTDPEAKNGVAKLLTSKNINKFNLAITAMNTKFKESVKVIGNLIKTRKEADKSLQDYINTLNIQIGTISSTQQAQQTTQAEFYKKYIEYKEGKSNVNDLLKAAKGFNNAIGGNEELRKLLVKQLETAKSNQWTVTDYINFVRDTYTNWQDTGIPIYDIPQVRSVDEQTLEVITDTKSFLEKIFGDGGLFSGLLKGIGHTLGKILDGVLGVIGKLVKVISTIVSGVGKIVGKLGSAVGKIVGKLGVAAGKIVGKLGAFVGKVGQGVVHAGGSIISAGGSIIHTVTHGVSSVLRHFGFASGGYTGQGIGQKDETGEVIAGVVHAGEWVAPRWMLQQYPTIFAILEGIRKNQGMSKPLIDIQKGNQPIVNISLNLDPIVNILEEQLTYQIKMYRLLDNIYRNGVGTYAVEAPI